MAFLGSSAYPENDHVFDKGIKTEQKAKVSKKLIYRLTKFQYNSFILILACLSFLAQVLNLQHHCLRSQKSGSKRWGVEKPLSHTKLLLWVSSSCKGCTSLGVVYALNSFVHSTAVDTLSKATSQATWLKERTQAITAAIFLILYQRSRQLCWVNARTHH